MTYGTMRHSRGELPVKRKEDRVHLSTGDSRENRAGVLRKEPRMCRMIAFASREPREIAPFLSHLARLSAQGKLVDGWERRPGGNHPDGWGIAIRQKGKTRLIRSGEPAATDPTLSGIRGSTDRFRGHARYASDTSTVNAANAHPFLVRGIALAHNGPVKGRIGGEAQPPKEGDTPA